MLVKRKPNPVEGIKIMLDKDGVAARIRNLRGSSSQKKFAERYGVTQGLISQIEKAIIDPSLRLLLLLSFDYGVSVDFILKGDSPHINKIHDPEKVAMKKFCDQLKIIQKEMESFRENQDAPIKISVAIA